MFSSFTLSARTRVLLEQTHNHKNRHFLQYCTGKLKNKSENFHKSVRKFILFSEWGVLKTVKFNLSCLISGSKGSNGFTEDKSINFHLQFFRYELAKL